MGRKHRRGKQHSAEKTAGPKLQTTVSSRYRFFRWMCAFFILATVFIRLDVITVWPGAEGWALDFAMAPQRGAYLPAFLHGLLLEPGASLFPAADLFFLFPRLLSAVLLLATGWLYYHWGSKLFGRLVAELHLLLAASSLWLPFFGKVATADSWAFFGHVGLWLSTLLLLRSDSKKYQFLQGGFVLLAGLAAPNATLALLLLLFVGLHWLSGHKDIWLKSWPSMVIGLVVAATLWKQAPQTYWFWGYNADKYGQFILYAFLGMLPAIGFLFGGLRDLIFKLKKQEALARSMVTVLVAALISQSLLFPLVLAALAGKQLQLFFTERYPWNNWVKGPAILHLIFAFFGSFFGLMSGLVQFRGDGYRAALGMVAAYWIFSLLAVLGLYGKRRDFTIGGTVLTGLLSLMFFWVQVYPWIEKDRDWPSDLIEQSGLPAGTQIVVPAEDELSTALPYLRRAGWLVDETGNYTLTSSPVDTIKPNSKLVDEGRRVFSLRRFKLEEN